MNSSALISAIDSGGCAGGGDAAGLHLGLLVSRVEECLAGEWQGLGTVRGHENLLFEVVAHATTQAIHMTRICDLVLFPLSAFLARQWLVIEKINKKTLKETLNDGRPK